ncbi:BTB/POZ domain and ankyrin repeat-containing protein NPR1-like [Silene latifolia]|uniref:BTB/POZ domain and ankyrin repeat-containing protein NPR1-like n=1 Tax=Silene latifolia TaxID=37657 RepID=UPI003D77B104
MSAPYAMMIDSRATAVAFSDSNDISNGTTTTTTSDIALSSDITALKTTAYPTDSAALCRLSDNLDSLFDNNTFELEFSYADATISCSNSHRHVSVHRAILSARSPFFKSLFASLARDRRDHKHAKDKDEKVKDKQEKSNSRLVKVELKDIVKDFDVGFDSLVSVLAYLYSGRVRALPKGVCVCVDDHCPHLACRPALDFLLQVLYLSHIFQIAELVALYQRHLLDILNKVELDDLLVVLHAVDMCGNTCEKLIGRCIEIIVMSNVDVITLEKSLPQHIVKQIIDIRKEVGFTGPEFVDGPDKHVKRIHRALESDDVELVRMLLKEGHTTLDDAFALHFAVAHCDAKTTAELLELGLADVNLRNQRGYTVIHIAAMRKEPKIVVSLLTKGAQPSELTSDNRKALQIAKRLTKAADFLKSTEQGKSSPKDRLCIEILEQAEIREPLLGEGSVSLAKAGDDLRMKLLYLENRVALARLLFPMEAKVAMEIAQVDGTSEFTLSKNMADARRNSVDLNEAPFILKDEHLQRMKALSKTVELGKRFFPRCSNVLNKIMDAEDLSQLAYLGNDTPEERIRKRKRYVELQDALTKAFTEDKEEFDRSTLSSSASSTLIGNTRDRMTFKR